MIQFLTDTPWLAQVSLVLGGIVLGFAAERVCVRWLGRVAKGTDAQWDDAIIRSIHWMPMIWFVSAGIYFAVLLRGVDPAIQGLVLRGVTVVVILSIVVVGWRFVGVAFRSPGRPQPQDSPLHDSRDQSREGARRDARRIHPPPESRRRDHAADRGARDRRAGGGSGPPRHPRQLVRGTPDHLLEAGSAPRLRALGNWRGGVRDRCEGPKHHDPDLPGPQPRDRAKCHTRVLHRDQLQLAPP